MTATTCAWCKVNSGMTWRSETSTVRIKKSGNSIAAQASFSCDHCGMLSIGTLPFQNINLSGIPEANKWWAERNENIRWMPEQVGGKEYPDVPAHIADAADEAHRCRSINAFRAAVLLARSVVEATAKDKGVTSGPLVAKIDELCSKGLIRDFTRKAAHELRYLGNNMAHGDFVDAIDVEDADAVLAVMAEVLNEVYQGPARVAAMQTKRLNPPGATA